MTVDLQVESGKGMVVGRTCVLYRHFLSPIRKRHETIGDTIDAEKDAERNKYYYIIRFMEHIDI
jgi:hypothetical protein